jgi:hypothetical protein
MADIMKCKAGIFPLTYFGLPLSDHKLTKVAYEHLLEQIQNRLPECEASLLSIGGRKVLVNAVLTAMSVYFMFAFLLPKCVTREIDRIRRSFL